MGKRAVKSLRKNKLHAFKHKGFWQCKDNIREWRYLNTLWEKSAPESMELKNKLKESLYNWT